MTRSVSANLRAAMSDQETAEIVVILLTVQHPAFGEDQFFSSDTADLLDYEKQLRGTISRGKKYSFLPMSVSLPEEGDDATQVISITLDNVAQDLTPLLKSITIPATVMVELVLASNPNFVEIQFPNFEMSSANVVAESVVISLTIDAMEQEPFPADNFTPATFGGLWSTT